MAEEIGLRGLPIIQTCRGMNSTVERSMELVSLHIRRLKEPETFEIQDVKLTDAVPELYHSLPNDFNIDSYDNFTDITYPINDHDCCDMLIGADIMHLLTMVEGWTPTAFPAPSTRSTHLLGGLCQAVFLKMLKTFKY